MTHKKSLSENIYQLYEKSVQDPKLQVDLAHQFYTEINRGKEPVLLREDFCGTFLICCEWVKKNPKFKAMGLDLDPVPIHYGKTHHLVKLSKEEQSRVRILKQNVISTTSPKADVIIGCNFSFNIFKDWDTLISYFKAARKSLNKNGIFSLEAAGGPGMIEETKERRRYQKNKKHWFTYIWHQKEFDPISRDGQYAIHFKLASGKLLEDAFTYDWRLWTIPEIRLAMKIAGFKDSCVYWEDSDDEGNELGTWSRIKKAPNDETWISYIIGINR